MSSSHNSSSHLMRRLVPKTLRGSRQNRTQIRTESPTTNASATLPFVSHTPTLPAAAAAMPALFPSEVQSDIFKNEPRSAPHPPIRPPRPPTLSTGDPIVTYHTNFLGLFSGDGETPIATTVPPKLTDLVPPMQVHPAEHDYDTSVPGETPATSRANRAPGVPRAKVIEDFDYVGGWIADAGGKQQYVSRGHIEEIEEDAERDVGIPSGSYPAGLSAIAGPSSRFLDALSLPASTTPPPRPMLSTKRDLPLSQSDSGSNNHPFHHPFFTKHKPLATTRQFAASPLSQSVSSLAHMPLRGFTSLHHTGGQGPTGPEQNTFFGPSASHDTDVDMQYEPLPVGSPPFDPLADSLSSLPGLRGFAPFTPNTERISEENITSTPEPFEHSTYPAFESLGHSLDSISPAQQADRSEKELPLPPSPTSQIPLPHPVLGTEAEGPMNPTLPTPAPLPHIGDLGDPIIILPLHESTPPRNPNRNGRTSGKNNAQPGDARNRNKKEKENRNDEPIEETEQRISTSIKEIVGIVRGVRGTLSSFYPVRTVVPHLEMCTHIEHSLSRVEKTLITRRTLTDEEWGLFMERRKRYVKRLGSLQRCLRRLSDVAKRPVEPTHTSMLDTLLRKLEEHNDKLTNVADKLDDTFERLKLRHLHAIASRLTEEAHRGRDVYVSAREVYLRRKSMTRKSTRNLREGARGLGKSATRKTSRIGLGGPRGFEHGGFGGTGGKGGDRPPRATRPTRPTVQPGMGSH
ncbi:uncharacterized protein C8R40DRAFT_512579 [Lentinula edodes]|uniref:uncharacterized protein n=1 Tax=Lentinula edodes TaxID=5353 RepID=UPI001E8CA7CB|nr:uncharacterized protein C8R40DRAFT_512579 [Lentinula edodes]KAH7871919.1 hypothetical protein C8R40DRAFT_512579 [Lentinula edodes]